MIVEPKVHKAYYIVLNTLTAHDEVSSKTTHTV